MQFNSIWLIDKNQSGATASGQSGPRSDGNVVVLNIPQSYSITWTSQSDCLMSYGGHSLGGSYPFAEMQSVYSTPPADWANCFGVEGTCILFSYILNRGSSRSVVANLLNCDAVVSEFELQVVLLRSLSDNSAWETYEHLKSSPPCYRLNSSFTLLQRVWFSLVWFYGISTFVGYLTPNPFLCK